jgi:hypothetical protein
MGWGTYSSARGAAEGSRIGLLVLLGQGLIWGPKLASIFVQALVLTGLREGSPDSFLPFVLAGGGVIALGAIVLWLWAARLLLADLRQLAPGEPATVKARRQVGLMLFFPALVGLLVLTPEIAGWTPSAGLHPLSLGMICGVLAALAARLAWLWRTGR